MKVTYRLFFVYLLVIVLSSSNLLQADDDQLKIDFLKKKMVKIKSLNIFKKKNKDLRTLKEMIGDARIVMLGEPNHGCGASMEAKARLVRFLHEEMGFNVLAWESNLHECELSNDLFKDKSVDLDFAAKAGPFPIWTWVKQIRPMFQNKEILLVLIIR